MVIARRTLKLRLPDRDIPFEVRIYGPEPAEPIDVACHVEVDWPGEPWRSLAVGVDSVQAIVLAFQMVGARLYTSSHYQAGRLVWLEAGQGYGFPLPRNLRDLHVGGDRDFDGA